VRVGGWRSRFGVRRLRFRVRNKTLLAALVIWEGRASVPSDLFLLPRIRRQESPSDVNARARSLKFSLRHELFACNIRLAVSKAGIAQLVEQLTCNQQVAGSNPAAGFLEHQRLT
jgi:hypothetical protein